MNLKFTTEDKTEIVRARFNELFPGSLLTTQDALLLLHASADHVALVMQALRIVALFRGKARFEARKNLLSAIIESCKFQLTEFHEFWNKRKGEAQTQCAA